MPYDLFEHRHRFAVWAAARAVQRGFAGAKTDTLVSALEESGVVKFAENPQILEGGYKKLHDKWCNSLMKNLKEKNPESKDVTFGRAAKLIAVYLKSMLVCGPKIKTGVVEQIYPPIDRILIHNMVKSAEFSKKYPEQKECLKKYLKEKSWTKLDKKGYGDLIKILSFLREGKKAFWEIEEYWDSRKNDGNVKAAKKR